MAAQTKTCIFLGFFFLHFEMSSNLLLEMQSYPWALCAGWAHRLWVCSPPVPTLHQTVPGKKALDSTWVHLNVCSSKCVSFSLTQMELLLKLLFCKCLFLGLVLPNWCDAYHWLCFFSPYPPSPSSPFLLLECCINFVKNSIICYRNSLSVLYIRLIRSERELCCHLRQSEHSVFPQVLA